MRPEGEKHQQEKNAPPPGESREDVTTTNKHSCEPQEIYSTLPRSDQTTQEEKMLGLFAENIICRCIKPRECSVLGKQHVLSIGPSA